MTSDDDDLSNEDATIRRPPTRAPVAAAPPRPLKLLCSVGRNGINRPDDVLVLRGLLNAGRPSPLAPATTEARCDADLIAAIEAFQTGVIGLATASGRVEPDSPALHALIGD